MGAEIEAHIWCDGPKGGSCGQNEYGPSITVVRAFLKELGWVKRTRDGEVVDLCPYCKEA